MTDDEIIAVVQARKAGKQIQYKEFFNQKNWRDTENPSWDFTHADYRVKPEPRTFYIPEWHDCPDNSWNSAYTDKEHLLSVCDKDELAGVIKVVEVLE